METFLFSIRGSNGLSTHYQPYQSENIRSTYNGIGGGGNYSQKKEAEMCVCLCVRGCRKNVLGCSFSFISPPLLPCVM
jgi:hypothetical protein